MNSEQSKSFIAPSDIGQSYVRIVIVFLLFLWAYFNEGTPAIDRLFSHLILKIGVAYVVYSFAFLILSYWLERQKSISDVWFHIKRVVCLVVDLTPCGLYILLAGEYGLAIYPVYVTIIVGYGLRYGFRYLFLAMSVALVTFTVAAVYSPLFAEFESLMFGFYLGLILIPGYAALLLKKYQDLLQRLSEVNAARARFIANMSHELRTPLHAIIGNAEVLGEKLGKLERSDRSFSQLSASARMVSEASEHLRTLVDGVLDIASNDAGTFVLNEPVETDLYRLIQSAVAITKPDSRKKNLEFSWFIDPDVPRTVKTWEQPLKAVLINTIGNAVKYTDSGSVGLRVRRREVNEGSGASTLEFRIEDTGIGITPTQLKTIYEPFAIGDDSRARRFEGTGLGLTITKQYLDEMNGRIDIHSESGVGTTVTIDLPIRVIDDFDTEFRANDLSALVIVPKGVHGDSRTWLSEYGFTPEIAEWDRGKASVEYTGDAPDVAFVDEACDEDVGAVADYLAVTYENALIVLMGTMTPADAGVPTSYVTRVEPGNLGHLRNLHSLIEREGMVEPPPLRVGYRILVVDDNETNLQSADIALTSFGHSVRTVGSGQDALAAMREEEFDLVFMDMHMPGLSGVEASRAYAASSKTPVPIVMLTADATSTASADAEIPEIAGFLTKPIKPSDLQLAVERYVSVGVHQSGLQEKGNRSLISDIVPGGSFSKENYSELFQSGVNKRSLDALVQKFRDDALSIIDELQLCVEQGDVQDMDKLLHKLKGSAAAMHIDGLLTVVDYYQSAPEEDRCRRLSGDIDRLRQVVREMAGEIGSFIHDLDR